MKVLTQKTVIVLDNASFHKNKQMLQIILDAGHIIELLPPYSADLNNIEHKWFDKKLLLNHLCSIEECYA
jgi:transposase